MSEKIHILKEPPFKFRRTKPIMYSIESATNCWNAISHRQTGGGYIQVQRNRQRMQAHRYSYELAKGKIPNGLCVLHKCDNPRCINPTHLFLGTMADNSWDAKQKGRIAHKLTEANVRAIRRDKGSTRKLGGKYRISNAQISRIKRNEQWRHIFVSMEA